MSPSSENSVSDEDTGANDTGEDQIKVAGHPVRHRVVGGRVVSDAMDKTIVVLIERHTQHWLYGKYIRRSSRLKVHDADNSARLGDFVEIVQGKPISRHKAWSLRRVVKRAGEFEAAG